MNQQLLLIIVAIITILSILDLFSSSFIRYFIRAFSLFTHQHGSNPEIP
jgi:hypothetical protein